MAGFRRRRRAPGAAQAEGEGRDSTTGVAPERRVRFRPCRDGDGESAVPVGNGGGRLTDAAIAASRPRATAVEYGISMLAARSWPEKKLREKIRTRYTEEETEAGLARLRELRLVDDVSWAERYARDRFERLGKGRHRIRMELLGKGIDAPTADAALDRVVGGDDERAKAAVMLEAMRGRLARGPGASRSGLRAGAGDPAGEGLETGPEAGETDPGDGPPMDARERRAQAERLKNRLFRRMLARGFPASVVRDLLDVS